MFQHLNFSWEIMPQLDLLWTGDLNIDCSILVLVILLGVICIRRSSSCDNNL